MFSNRAFLSLSALVLGAGALMVSIVINKDPSMVMLTMGGVALALAALTIPEKWLPVVLLLILSLGSCYNWQLSLKSFYVRFFFLGFLAVRSLVVLLRGDQPGDKSTRGAPSAIEFGFLTATAIGLFSSPVSEAPGLVAQRALSFFLLYIVIFRYFIRRITSIEEAMDYAVSEWLTLAILLGLGFALLLTGDPEMYYGGRLRLVIGNPNQLAHFIALMAPIANWYAMERVGNQKKWIGWTVLALAGIAAIGSGSRGGLLAIVISLSIQYALCYRKRLFVMLLAVGLIGMSHLLLRNPAPRPGEDPSFFQETVLRENTLESGSGRTDVWKAAWRRISIRPYFGHGFGVTDELFMRGYFPEIPVTFQGGHVHNGYIEELVNLGWVGSSPIFFTFLYILISGPIILFSAHRITPNFTFACALFCSVVAGLISGMIESWFTSVGSVFCFPFWLNAGMFVVITRKFRDWSA